MNDPASLATRVRGRTIVWIANSINVMVLASFAMDGLRALCGKRGAFMNDGSTRYPNVFGSVLEFATSIYTDRIVDRRLAAQRES